ncbi:cold shock domain-containing protein [Propionivibrio sp.]|uniref:cold shock domain-containing protein n=1 Tax=Propionivibrio sp. TaxID=2212460 RepID=UPI0039E5D793
MRIEGQLKKWNEDRGFGFIASVQGGPEIFVHVSAFPRDGQRPRIGERLSFEIETDNNGKQRAIHLVCLDRQVRRQNPQGRTARRGSGGIVMRIFQLAIVVALAAYGYAEYSNRTSSRPIATVQSAIQASSASFRCDGRTHCSQMTSCAEAMFFLKNCPNVKMDGNNDGIPCEQQWCK